MELLLLLLLIHLSAALEKSLNSAYTEIGELCVRSGARTKGYHNDEEATKADFDDAGWFHTGDAAYYDENGELFVVDRIKAAMKYRTHLVWPSEIEALLIKHPDEVEVRVLPIPHEIDGEHPMAFLKRLPGLKITEEELVKFTESLGEVKKLHGGVSFVDDLPKLNSTKLDRQTLRNWYTSKQKNRKI